MLKITELQGREVHNKRDLKWYSWEAYFSVVAYFFSWEKKDKEIKFERQRNKV